MSRVNEEQDWICSFKWEQATPGDGIWVWALYRVDEGPTLHKLAEGMAFNRLVIFWRVWKECRKHGLTFRPWSNTWRHGTLPEDLGIR